jgi:hypothetical protein
MPKHTLEFLIDVDKCITLVVTEMKVLLVLVRDIVELQRSPDFRTGNQLCR